MARIEKLQIQGFRSFTHEDKNQQKIAFYRTDRYSKEKISCPLTLILGQNGCGKTTIIECLKYMTTGAPPPGSDRGKNFVHDPKLAKENIIKAHGKLQFVGNDGKRYVIARTMEANRSGKAKNVTIKTLDSAMFYEDPQTGDKKHLSGKCADLDIEVLRLFGISEPILNYVIFCHQEDSNWPMEEGSKVKLKFDEIFAAERYNQLLKNIKEIRKGQMIERDKTAKDVSHYKDVAKETTSKERDLKKLKRQYEENESFKAEQNDELEKLQEKLHEYNESERNFTGIQTKITEAKNNLKHIRGQMNELKNSLGEDNIIDDEDQIEREEETLANESQSLRNEKEQIEEDLIKIQKLVKSERRKYDDIKDKVGQAKAYHETHEKNRRKIEKIIREVGENLDFGNMIPEEITTRFVEETLENIDGQKDALEDEKNTAEADFQKKIEANQTQLTDLNLNKAKLEQKKESMTDSKIKKNRELALIKRQLSELKGSSAKLAELKTKLEKKDTELKNVQKSVDLDVLEDEIDRKSETVKELNDSVKILRQDLTKLSTQRDLYSKKSLKEKELSEKTGKIKRLLNKNNAELETIFEENGGNTPKLDKIKKSFDDIFTKKENEKSKLDEKKMQLETNGKHDAKNLKTLLEQVQSDDLRIKQFQQQLGSLNTIDSFDDDLKNAKANVEKIREELQVKEANKHTFNQFIQKMEKSKHCPTCKRGFDQDEDCQEVIEFLKKEIKNVPTKVKYIKSRLDEAQEIEEKLEKMRPEKISCLALRDQLDEKNNEIEDLKTKQKTDQKTLSDIKEKLEVLDEIFQAFLIRDDVFQIDILHTESLKLEQSIKELQNELGESDENAKDYDEVKQEEELKTQELENLRESLEDLKSRKSDFEAQKNKLERERNTLQNDKLTLEGQSQNRANTENKKTELEKSISNDDKEIKKIQHDLQPLEERIQDLTESQTNLNNEKDQMINRLGPKIDQIRGYHRELEQKLEEIKQYENSGKAGKMKSLQNELSQSDEKVQANEAKEKGLNDKMNENFQKVTSKENRERMLADNRKLQILDKEKTTNEGKVEALENKLESLNYDSIRRERQKIIQHHDQVNKEKHKLLGKQGEISNSIEKFEKELERDFYKLAKTNYRKSLVEKCARDKVIDDLNKYYIALEWSILRYHKDKMKEINRRMKELWRATYKGNDIDYIEVKTDEAETSQGADKRRTSQYKVVMRKGEAELEMRGRCSAGQKVLGSLVLRLALAETFSTNCGIIALDEPTTNLDHANINSLAEALTNLVTNSPASNFQLIIITHDEDFIDTLVRSDQTDHFWRVSRNEAGQSIIRKEMTERA